MTEIDYPALQQRYEGRYVLRRDGDVLASAETYDELSEQLGGRAAEWDELTIAHIEPATAVHVY